HHTSTTHISTLSLHDALPISDLATLEEEAFVVAKAMEPERTYAFRQALIREVAYQIQLLATRRSTHTAIGRALEALYPDRLDELDRKSTRLNSSYVKISYAVF